MTKINKTLLSDVIQYLPEIEKFAPKENVPIQKDELFICALGFEQRCLTIPRKLNKLGYKTKSSVYVKYNTNQDDNYVNLQELQSNLERFSDEVLKPLEIDSQTFANDLRTILNGLKSKNNKPPSVTLDISVFANRLILSSLNTLLESDIDLKILYSEADIYHPTKDEYDQNPQKWKGEEELGLERGVNTAIISSEYPGQHLEIMPHFIIIFPCFKKERSKAIIAKVDPSLLIEPDHKVAWIIGDPHLKKDKWRKGAMREINDISEEEIQYEVSTFNYTETLKILEKLYQQKWNKCNITLALNGSKMQAIGSTLFCYLHPDVRVVFAIPKEYNAKQYTKNCRDTWIINIESTKKLRMILDSIGNISISK